MQFNNNGIEKEVTVNLKPDVLYESPDEFIHLELEFELLKYFSSSSSNNIINPDTRTCTQGLLGCNGFDLFEDGNKMEAPTTDEEQI